MDKNEFSVRAILGGRAPSDAPVTVKGWVRTRCRSFSRALVGWTLVPAAAGGPVEAAAQRTRRGPHGRGRPRGGGEGGGGTGGGGRGGVRGAGDRNQVAHRERRPSALRSLA